MLRSQRSWLDWGIQGNTSVALYSCDYAGVSELFGVHRLEKTALNKEVEKVGRCFKFDVFDGRG